MNQNQQTNRSSLPSNETVLARDVTSAFDGYKFDIVIWAHSDQTGGSELACELAVRVIDALRGMSFEVAIVCSEQTVEDVRKRLAATLGFDFKFIIPVKQSLTIVKTCGCVDPAETEKDLLAKFGSDAAVEAFRSHNFEQVSPHTHDKTLILSCGEPLAVAFARERSLRCVIVSDILLPDAVRHIVEYGGHLSPPAARALMTLANFDREADEAYLAPPEFCGTDYDVYFATGGVRAQSIGGLFYQPLGRVATGEYRNQHLRQLRANAGDDRVVFVFGGGGLVFLELYEKLANELKQHAGNLNYAVLVPAVKRKQQKLQRVSINRVYQYTLFKSNGTEADLGDPGSLAFWYAGVDLVVGRGGLVAQQVLATMLAEDPPVRPFMHFIEELGHCQIEHERRSLYRMGFVSTSTFAAFWDAPFTEIERALARKTPKSTEILRLRAQARYGMNCLDHAIRGIISTYL